MYRCSATATGPAPVSVDTPREQPGDLPQGAPAERVFAWRTTRRVVRRAPGGRLGRGLPDPGARALAPGSGRPRPRRPPGARRTTRRVVRQANTRSAGAPWGKSPGCSRGVSTETGAGPVAVALHRYMPMQCDCNHAHRCRATAPRRPAASLLACDLERIRPAGWRLAERFLRIDRELASGGAAATTISGLPSMNEP